MSYNLYDISFLVKDFTCGRYTNELFKGTAKEIEALMGSKHRVLFQNADDTINMGVIFNDPDMELYDVYWYIVLAELMERSLKRNEGLITVDRKLNTKSCYVELHRNGD